MRCLDKGKKGNKKKKGEKETEIFNDQDYIYDLDDCKKTENKEKENDT